MDISSHTKVDHVTSSCYLELGHTTQKSLSWHSQNYGRRGINCVSSPSFNLEKDALSVVLSKAATVEKASSVVRCLSHNYKRIGIKCVRTLEEYDPRLNCRRSYSKCGSSLMLQMQKKRHQVWFVIKVETIKEETSSMVRRRSRNCKKKRYFMCGSSSKPQL
ncbi:hypothetical protein H5410_002116 [Solanum commersonii]|uniref:Uncharacterized protein n=1 Tax=Solanum commersonii TaxID=4109 RepID=A0A9J6B1Z5_SOLCO|nr:hypothetical protein H5410_002116 [Solanum commersonii]